MTTTHPFHPAGGRGPEPGDRAPASSRPIRQVRRLRFAGSSGVVPRARDFARQALHDWGWLPADTEERQEACEDILLVVSELVTNACLHAQGPEELRIAQGAGNLRVEVVDSGSGAPEPRLNRSPGRPGGHGMFIVERLSRDWGVAQEAGGTKTVWAELPAPF
ncbi:ATP-binding protein [Streptomyces sodiiphilus]|uniref:ATP-binding protein n=1 Tax=Streptomyces sodiiphilus TaxID=226217 RepID=A0ABN2PKB8_9ACTN